MLALLQSIQCVLGYENQAFGMIHLRREWSLIHEALVVTTHLKSFFRVGLRFSFFLLSGILFSAKAIKDFLWPTQFSLGGFADGHRFF